MKPVKADRSVATCFAAPLVPTGLRRIRRVYVGDRPRQGAQAPRALQFAASKVGTWLRCPQHRDFASDRPHPGRCAAIIWKGVKPSFDSFAQRPCEMWRGGRISGRIDYARHNTNGG